VSAWRLRKFTTCRSTGGLQPNYPNDHEDRGSLGFWRIDSGRVLITSDVEARGVEPLSSKLSTQASTCVADKNV